MEEVGVEAVVKGLSQFLGDMRQVNSAIDGLRPSGSLLQQMFASLAESAGNFAREILNVAEVALGVMLRDAIEFVIGKIRDLIAAIIDAGSEFQILQLRLERLNFNTLIESGMNFNDAMTESIRLTKEQIQWIQTLAVLSPYDAQDIANTFTLARTYGFTADEAKRLTQNIIDFAAGMGLSNEEMQRIIINFGQLMQQGKLNAQDLKDLGRGAFVPINAVFEKMAKNMGITVDELNKMRKAGEGGPEMVTKFIEAFNQLVEERFVGASEKMSRTFLGAKQNLADLFKSILGFNVVTPILDTIGGKIADYIEAFSKNKKQWDALVDSAKLLGTTLSDIVAAVLGLLPSAQDVAKATIEGFRGISAWIVAHKADIIKFFQNVGKAIGEVVAWVRESLLPVFERILTWVFNNRGTILNFFGSLLSIIGTVIGNLLGGTATKGDVLGGVLSGLKNFMQFVIDNKDKIAAWVTIFAKLFIAAEVVITVFNIFVGVLGWIVGAVITVIGVITTLIGLFALVANPVGAAIIYFVALAAQLVIIAVLWAYNLYTMYTRLVDWINNNKKAIIEWATNTWNKFIEWRDNVLKTIADWCAEAKRKIDVWATDVWTSITTWATNTWNSIKTWATNTWNSFITWRDDVLKTIEGWGFQFVADVDAASNGAVGKFDYYTTKTGELLATWVTNQASKLQEWVDDTNAKHNQAAEDSKTAYSDWISTTYASLVQWVNDTNAKHQENATNAKNATNDWTAATFGSIGQWITDTGASLDTWRATEKAKADQWWKDFTQPITDWAEGAKKSIDDWIAGVTKSFVTWRDDIVEKFKKFGGDIVQGLYDGLVSVTAWLFERLAGFAEDIYNTVAAALGAQSPSTLFFGLGVDIVQGLIDGVGSMGQILIDTLTNLALEAWQAAMDILGIASPSKVFFQMGEYVVEGLALGIERTARLAAAAMTDAVSMVMAPTLVMPSMAVAYASGGGAGSQYNTSTENNYNLSIQSSADREPIIQDFGMLRSLQGG